MGQDSSERYIPPGNSLTHLENTPCLCEHCGAALLLCGVVLLGLHLPSARADDKKDNTAVKPAVHSGTEKRHEGFVAIAKKGDVDVLFLGDSITEGWEGGGKEVWKKDFRPLKAANFGIGGDRTQHVLWRMQNGELEGIKPKAAVLMIGTNNPGSNTAEEIADGIEAIVAELRKKRPTPKSCCSASSRAAQATDKRAKIKDINTTSPSSTTARRQVSRHRRQVPGNGRHAVPRTSCPTICT